MWSWVGRWREERCDDLEEGEGCGDEEEFRRQEQQNGGMSGCRWGVGPKEELTFGGEVFQPSPDSSGGLGGETRLWMSFLMLPKQIATNIVA